MKKKVTLSIDDAVWRKFRAGCISEGHSASALVERLMDRWFEEKSTPQSTPAVKVKRGISFEEPRSGEG